MLVKLTLNLKFLNLSKFKVIKKWKRTYYIPFLFDSNCNLEIRNAFGIRYTALLW